MSQKRMLAQEQGSERFVSASHQQIRCGHIHGLRSVLVPWATGLLQTMQCAIGTLSSCTASPPTPFLPPRSYRIYAWRWHHLALERDLLRIERILLAFSQHPPSSPASIAARGQPSGVVLLLNPHYRARLADAFRFIIQANWQVHDHVEEHLLLPFVLSLCPDALPPLRDDSDCPNVPIVQRRAARPSVGLCPSYAELRHMAERRTHLTKSRTQVLEMLDRWVSCDSQKTANSAGRRRNAAASARCCVREAQEIHSAVASLHESVRQAFDESEKLVVPVVAERASREAQEAFNRRVVQVLDQGRARAALVLFHDAVMTDSSVVDIVSGPLPQTRRSDNGQDGRRMINTPGATVKAALSSRADRGRLRTRRQDQIDFRTSIPKPIRMLISVWRSQSVRTHMAILDELQP